MFLGRKYVYNKPVAVQQQSAFQRATEATSAAATPNEQGIRHRVTSSSSFIQSQPSSIRPVVDISDNEEI